MPDKMLLTGQEVAARYGVTPGAVTRWRARGLPSKEVATAVILYDDVAVDRWCRAQGINRVASGAVER